MGGQVDGILAYAEDQLLRSLPEPSWLRPLACIHSLPEVLL